MNRPNARPATRRPLRAVFLLVALALLGGCASPGPYRGAAAGQAPVIERPAGAGYALGFVEFDEHGWFWSMDRAQLSAVERMILEEAGAVENRAGRAATTGVILVVFVHGWKNNAAPDNGNVAHFRELLESLAATERELHPGREQRVVGVYLGWPGEYLTIPGVKNAGFYARKNAGDRTGYYGGVTETLARIEKLHDYINAHHGSRYRNYLVVAGHSFGGQVVYNSLSQIMADRLVDARVQVELAARTQAADAPAAMTAAKRRATERVVKPFGDIVLLINPAFEASRYYNLKTLSELLTYPGAQRPVLTVFSSETDSANRHWFPVGRFFSTLLQRYRNDGLGPRQKDADHHTIPWTNGFVTHRLGLRDEINCGGDASPLTATTAAEAMGGGHMARIIAGWDARTRAQRLDLAGASLCPLNRDEAAWTPFYVVDVKKSLIDGHSDIWRGPFREFVARFIAVSMRTSAE